MKKWVVALLLIVGVKAYANAYVDVQGGVIASPGSQAPVYGIRAGVAGEYGDISMGYWSARGMRSDNLVSDSLDLHTFSAEYYINAWTGSNWRSFAGGGIGYTIPNLSAGASETAENGRSWVAGIGAEYDIYPDLSINALIKGFWFSTETHVTSYGSHPETLSTGQDIEVLDVTHYDNHVNVNSVMATVALRWR